MEGLEHSMIGKVKLINYQQRRSGALPIMGPCEKMYSEDGGVSWTMEPEQSMANDVMMAEASGHGGHLIGRRLVITILYRTM